MTLEGIIVNAQYYTGYMFIVFTYLEYYFCFIFKYY